MPIVASKYTAQERWHVSRLASRRKHVERSRELDIVLIGDALATHRRVKTWALETADELLERVNSEVEVPAEKVEQLRKWIVQHQTV